MPRVLIFCLFAVAVTACTGEAASRYFQLCLTEDVDRRALETMLEQYAYDLDLEFSAATAEDKDWNRQVSGQTDPVSVHVKEDGEHFILAGNMTMGDAQIMIAVFEGRNDPVRVRLANELGRRLQEKWDMLETIAPEGGGVQQLENCPYRPWPFPLSG